MFGLGMQEIIVIFVLALDLLGPKKLPELAQTLGKFMRDFQRAADEVKREITTPVNELKHELNDQARKLLDAEPDRPPKAPDPTAAVYGITPDAAEKTPDAAGGEKTKDENGPGILNTCGVSGRDIPRPP